MKNFLDSDDYKIIKESCPEEEILAYIEFRNRQIRKLQIEVEELVKIIHGRGADGGDTNPT